MLRLALLVALVPLAGCEQNRMSAGDATTVTERYCVVLQTLRHSPDLEAALV